MYIQVKNENYGYSVATHNDWVIVGNPNSFRYNTSLPGQYHTGSVDIFKYNYLKDQHDLLLTVYKPMSAPEGVLLASDHDPADAYLTWDEITYLWETWTGSFGTSYTDPSASILIHTDTYKSYWIPTVYFMGIIPLKWSWWNLGDIPIQVDSSNYGRNREDDYGHSIDVYNNVLAIGSRWHNQTIKIGTTPVYIVTGSSVDIYNLTLLNSTPYDGYVSTGSLFLANVITPPTGESVSGSFGHSVSLNDEWLAVGSPNWKNTYGGVHMYRRNIPHDPNNLDFTFHSTITGSLDRSGSYFGYAVDINKQTGSYSGSLLVGCGNKITSGSKAYYFEFNGSSWSEQFVFNPDTTVNYLTFYDTNPILLDNNSVDGFGNAVALYGDDVVIGAPTDRWFYEYSSSNDYNQGTAYLYNRCPVSTRGWRLIKKFYGNDKVIKNNKMGFSVDVWDDKMVIGCPKYNAENLDKCYLQGSSFQYNYCNPLSETYAHGQIVLLQKNTSSAEIDWDVSNVYRRKKKYLSPYRAFGYDVAIADKSIVVGAPMIISGSYRDLDIQYTSSWQGDTLLNLEDFTGKAYIYNLSNFRNSFNVGNVFYRNGKIILNTSGSVFDGLWFNPINNNTYEYTLNIDNKQTLYEKQFICTINPGEFNISQNPSATIREKSVFDINGNGYFDWQDLDVTLRYMKFLTTKYYSSSMDWSSSVLKTDDEISYYNYYSTYNSQYYNTEATYISQSFFDILNRAGNSQFDFNQDSKIDDNDLNILWKYYSKRLTQENYQSYITSNSKRKLFNEIIDYLDNTTKMKSLTQINPEFLLTDEKEQLDPTGSYLRPYITSVGLYDDSNLIAVAKLGQPIKNVGTYPINIIVKMDF